MTKDDIIKLAGDCDLGRVCGPLDTLLDYEWEKLQRFATLVAAAERESCANLCEDTNQEYEPFTGQPRNLSYTCANAIRARGTT